MRVFIALLTVAVLLCLLSCENKTTEPNPNVVQTPDFNPSGGTYEIGQDITMTCLTSGVEIRYTIDGSEPSAESQLYVNPLIIPTIFPVDTNAGTVKAKAFKEGYDPSATRTATYAVTYANTVAMPVITPTSGSIAIESLITMTCSTSDVQIRYTLNGSAPTSTSTLYTQPFRMIQSGQVTIKARAFRNTWNPSPIASMNYTITLPVPEMVYVEGGTFNNGTSDVNISQFYIGKYELTQAEYQSVMASWNADPYGYGSAGIGDNYPVYYVSWFDSIEYCNRRSINENLTPCYNYSTYGCNPATWPEGWNSNWDNHTNVSCNWAANGYRLPTEAEWEFAARGGNFTHDYTYSGSNDLEQVAWYSANSGNTTHIVGAKTLNEIGLSDMSGNVYEWNWDIFGNYPGSAQTNPHGAVSGSYRVLRGGSWGDDAVNCPVSLRHGGGATNSDNDLGFRCVRVSP